MYKMIVLDLDGTLLNDYKEVSIEDRKMIQRAYEEKGVITVIATGRPLGYVMDICNLNENPFTEYVIACNGALIKNIKTNKYINKMTLSNEEILNIRNLFLKEELNYIIMYTEEQAIKEEDISVVKEVGDINQNIEEVINENPSLAKYLCIVGVDRFPEENLRNFIEKLETLENLEKTVICNYLHKYEDKIYESKYIDIMRKGCSKKNAINVLAENFDIKHEEIIVMGDGGNDIPMFEVGGLKIAMANAEDYIKEKADYITSSNNDSGVAKAIQKFVFNEGE